LPGNCWPFTPLAVPLRACGNVPACELRRSFSPLDRIIEAETRLPTPKHERKRMPRFGKRRRQPLVGYGRRRVPRESGASCTLAPRAVRRLAMTTQNVALPVTFFIAVILVMGAYAFWLWLQLWFLQQATRRVRDTIVGEGGARSRRRRMWRLPDPVRVHRHRRRAAPVPGDLNADLAAPDRFCLPHERRGHR